MATDTPATARARRIRGQAVAQDRYQRRLTAAGDDPRAEFIAHVDRIRALKDTLLIRAASAALTALIDIHAREIHGPDPARKACDLQEHPESSPSARQIQARENQPKEDP